MRILKVTALILAIIPFLWLAGYVAFVVSAISVTPEKPGEKTEAIIVVTGGNHRIKTGLDLLAHNRAGHLFISGVHPGVTRWKIMSLWDETPPLPDCCIDLGTHATTTTENAKEVREWMERKNFTSARLVSSNYHIHRALLELRHEMPEAEILAHPVTTPDYTPDQKRFWTITFGEYNKILYRIAQMPFYGAHP